VGTLFDQPSEDKSFLGGKIEVRTAPEQGETKENREEQGE
jgi:hypothetical protein